MMEENSKIENELTRLEIRALKEQVTALEVKVLELSTFLLDRLLLEFAQKKTESGELEFPRFVELGSVMSDIIGSQQTKSLEQAYLMAARIMDK